MTVWAEHVAEDLDLVVWHEQLVKQQVQQKGPVLRTTPTKHTCQLNHAVGQNTVTTRGPLASMRRAGALVQAVLRRGLAGVYSVPRECSLRRAGSGVAQRVVGVHSSTWTQRVLTCRGRTAEGFLEVWSMASPSGQSSSVGMSASKLESSACSATVSETSVCHCVRTDGCCWSAAASVTLADARCPLALPLPPSCSLAPALPPAPRRRAALRAHGRLLLQGCSHCNTGSTGRCTMSAPLSLAAALRLARPRFLFVHRQPFRCGQI